MTIRNAVAMGSVLILASMQALAGTPPAELEPVALPFASNMVMLSMSVILAGLAARYIARRVKRT